MKIKNKIIPFIFMILLVILPGCSLNQITGAAVTNNDYVVTEEGAVKVVFCPLGKCEEELVAFLGSAESSIHCALFEVGLENVKKTLLEKSRKIEIEVQVVTDDTYIKKFNQSFVKKDRSGLMHNKFCVIDGKKITTGAMNPSDNGAYKNDNNQLYIESATLARNYEEEFQELWNETFKKGKKVDNPGVMLGEVKLKNYFCPEDDCAERVKDELKKAKQEIYFMTFSFTHEGIANILLLKNLDGILVKGVMERSQVSEYSQFKRLEYQGIDVLKDKNPSNMHNKVFIIDNKTVVTGSFNPTEGGNERNDENVLVVEDEEIAGEYLKEFERVYGVAEG